MPESSPRAGDEEGDKLFQEAAVHSAKKLAEDQPQLRPAIVEALLSTMTNEELSRYLDDVAKGYILPVTPDSIG
ncbi:MAG TPA: hypothetical protein VLE74_02040 [Candidatus Saccharimonadales bacterium]|nr:hypothetical protein [Candidatus Saccharimonadales bacterium]